MGFLEQFEEQTRPDVERKPWMDDVTMELVTTATLDSVIDACIESKLYAMDIETTGMDNRVFNGRTRDKIVGVGLSPDGERGYYIPVRHKKGEKHNLEPSVVVAALQRLVASEAVAIFHNAKFDTEFLQFSELEAIGTWDKVKDFEDTLILAWLRNTRERNKTLKHLSKIELEKEMIELDELFDADEVKKRKGRLDFSELDPGWGPCLWYACSDVICTYQLFHVLHPQVIAPKEKRVRSQKNIYNLEKLCVPATRWMERCRVWIDPEKVTELIQLGQQEFFDCVCDVYDFCNEALGRNVEPGWVQLLRTSFVADNPDYNINQQIDNCRTNARRKGMDELDADGHYRKTGAGFPQQYDILSRQQLGPLFQELKIPDLRKTEKKKQIQTTQAEIERLNERYGHRYPFLPKIKRLGELQKALGTYLISLHNDVGPDGTLRVNYQQLGTDTGRFTTPASMNPALDGGTKYPMHGTPAIYQKKRPQCLLRIREAIKARPGKMLVAIDFGGVELRIATILSGEPKWLKEFFRCSTCGQEFERGDGKTTPTAPPAYCPKCGDDRIGDLHTLTGITFFGEENVGTKQWKQMRNQAKCVHPDTLVFAEEGLHRVGAHYSFGGTDEFVPNTGRLWNGREFQDIRASYNGGKKKLFHVVTHRGIVTCSDQHRFKLANGRLLSIRDGLVKGMALQFPETPSLRSAKKWPVINYRGKEDLPEVAIHTNSKLAYLCGLYVGDGTKSGDRSVSITHGSVDKKDLTGVPYSEWQDEIVSLTEDLGFRPVRRKQSVYLGSRGVMRYLAALGLIGSRNERLLRVPDWVLKAGREAAMAFLGGLIDSDGTVSKKDAEPSVTTKDAVFAGQVMALLRALGFVARAEACWNKTYRRWYYRLHLKASEAPRLRRYLRHRGKRERIRGARAPNRAVENEVLQIIPAGTQPCVDVSMKGRSHLYWCNGLITHNSANFAMVYGGGPSALLRSIDGCTEEDATRHHRGFTSTYSTLKAWWDEIKAFGRQNGYVMTAFGRHYPIPDIQLPTSGRGVVKALQDKYKEKLAAGEEASPPTEEQIKRQVEWNRKFKAKAERNATNGPIQGLSADLTKLAMAMIYRECKKRDWLEKIYMVITIHDELVFEIDYDIAGEAIELFQEIMTRNQTILDRKWPIPLTTDCEVGYDWTVPYDVKDFRHKRVRPDGLQVDEKGRLPRDKETGKLKAKLWPPEFVKIFGPRYGFASVTENLTAEEGRELFGDGWEPLELGEATEPTEPAPPSEAPVQAAGAPSVPTAPTLPEMPRLERGDVFVYRLRNLGVGVANKLAHVIVECQGRGSHPLRVIAPTGEDVLWDDASIMVNPHEFRTAANYHGI